LPVKYIKNMIAFYSAYALNFIANFVLLKILTNFVPQDTLGRFFFVTNAGLFLSSIALLGFPLTIQRFVPIYNRENLREKALTIIHIPALFHLSVGVISSLIYFIFRGRVEALLFFSSFILSTMSIYQTALISEMRIVEYAFSSFPRILLVVILTLLAKNRLDLSTLSAIHFSVNSAFFLLLFTLFPLRFVPWKEVFSEIKSYLSYSSLTQLLSPFFLYVDSVLIPVYLPFRELSLFQVARKLDFGARQTLEVPLQLTAPLISFKRTDEILTQSFAQKYRAFRTFYFYLSLFWFLLFQFAGKFIIVFITSKNYLQSYPYLMLLTFSLLVSSIYAPDAMFARSIGNIKLFFLKDIVYISTLIIAFFFLTPKLGLLGVSLSFLVAVTITALYHITNFKTISSMEYQMDAFKIILLGMQALIYGNSKSIGIPIVVIATVLFLDFKNLNLTFKIIKGQWK